MRRRRIRGFRGRAAARGVCWPLQHCHYRHCCISICVSLIFFCRSGEGAGRGRTAGFPCTARAGALSGRYLPCPHLPAASHPKGQKRRDSLLLAMSLFHFPVLTFVIQGAGHPPVTTLGGWHLIFVIIFVSFAIGDVDMLAVRKENP